MSEAEVNKALICLHHYLEKAIPAPCNFKQEIHEILVCLDRYIDPHYPYRLNIQDEPKTGWYVVYIATYIIRGKRIAVDLVAYLDRQVVRFLRSSSCLKFNDTLPESKGLSDEEKISCYLSERYLLPFSSILQPGQGKYYSQRLLSIINRIIDVMHNNSVDQRSGTSTDLRKLGLSNSFEELLRFLNEILSRTPPTGNYPTGDITYTLDEILLLLDDFLGQLTCGQVVSEENLLRWKKTLSLKIRTLLLLIKPENADLRLHYHRKLVLVTIIAIIPWLDHDSAYLCKSFQSLQQHLGFAQSITLDFLQSLLEDIETYLLLSKNYDYHQRIKKWERACYLFFSSHRERCFIYPSSEAKQVYSPPSYDEKITSNNKIEHPNSQFSYLQKSSDIHISSSAYHPLPDFTSRLV